ncbi:MAG TPA: hypothetical protein VF258_06745, partial [Luteolibacter sp.]
MELKTFIPPAIALMLSMVWIGHQRQSLSTLVEESALLEKHIAAAHASGPIADPAHAHSAGPAKSAKDKEPIDWKKIAGQLAESRQSGGMGDMRTMIKLQQRLQSMSKEDLLAALDEIAALDLTADARKMLEQMLIGTLAQKEPELVLSKFIDRLSDDDGTMRWTLANAWRDWAKKDLTQAAAWFDQQIAAGKFDSKTLSGESRSRNQFEGSLIHVLLGSDPEGASRRLAAMPANQRNDVLSTFSSQQLKEQDQLAFAKLVRDQLPEKDQADSLAQQAFWLVDGDGYAKVTGYLDRIAATPSERTAVVEKAAESRIRSIAYQKKVTIEDLDAMRE